MTNAPARPSRTRLLAAGAVAAVADLLQVFLFPFFFEGFLSPLNNALDVVVAVALVWLLGWHWVLLPSLVAEAIPGLDLVPTWTGAVLWVALRKGAQPPAGGALALPEGTQAGEKSP